MDYAIGIDLGGTNIKIVAVSKAGELLAQHVDRIAEERVAWAEHIRGQIARIEAEQGSAANWVGLAAPGLAATDGRSIVWMQGRLEEVQGLDWTQYLGTEHVIPVVNDAHAALLGEAWQGAAAGYRNVMMLTLGTGVGGGVLVDGRLLKGHIGRAGHLGHISLNATGHYSPQYFIEMFLIVFALCLINLYPVIDLHTDDYAHISNLVLIHSLSCRPTFS